MKKGFILTLLVAAVMVSLVLPASANAPIVRKLPSVIIGEAGDVTGSSGELLFRSLGVTDLLEADTEAQWIDWNNPTLPVGDFHLYYLDDGSSTSGVEASNATALVPALTGAEYTALLTGTKPAATSDILAGGNTSLDLIDLNNTTGVPASAALADPDVNGVVAGVAGSEFLTLIAAVDSSVGGVALASGELLVTTEVGAGDSVSTPVAVIGRVAATDAEWRQLVVLAGGNVEAGVFMASPAVGFDVLTGPATPGNLVFASWQLIEEQVVEGYEDWRIKHDDLPAGSFYLAEYQLRSNSPTADTCPGFRLFTSNENYTHLVMLTVDTKGDGYVDPTGITFVNSAEDMAPYEANDLVAYLAWAPHTDALDMGASGEQGRWVLNAVGPIVEDQRDYTLFFELFHKGATDSGQLELVTYGVRAVAEADLGTPAATVTTTNFQDWFAAAHAFGATIGQGTVAGTDLAATANVLIPSATSVNLSFSPPLAAETVGRLAAVNSPQHFTYYPASFLAHNDDQMVIVTTTLSAGSADPDASSAFRLYLYSITNDADGDGTEGEATGQAGDTWYIYDDWVNPLSMIWMDASGAFEVYGKSPIFRAGATQNQENPGTPAAGGTAFKSYCYTHKVRPGDTAPYLFPQVQIFSKNAYTSSNAWPDDAGGETVDSVQLDAYDF